MTLKRVTELDIRKHVGAGEMRGSQSCAVSCRIVTSSHAPRFSGASTSCLSHCNDSDNWVDAEKIIGLITHSEGEGEGECGVCFKSTDECNERRSLILFQLNSTS